MNGTVESYGNSCGNLCLIDELPDYFLNRLHNFTFPPVVYEGSDFSLPTFVI